MVVAVGIDGTPQPTDDFTITGERVSLIRGNGTGRAMFGPNDQLPAAYQGMPIVLMGDKINGHWERQALLITGDGQVSSSCCATPQSRSSCGTSRRSTHGPGLAAADDAARLRGPLTGLRGGRPVCE